MSIHELTHKKSKHYRWEGIAGCLYGAEIVRNKYERVTISEYRFNIGFWRFVYTKVEVSVPCPSTD